MSFGDKLSELRFKFSSARKQKLKQERIVISQRHREMRLNEEIGIIKDENELLMQQLNELNSQISQMQCRLAMIDVCRTSEEAKVQVYITNLDSFKNEYNDLFQKENQIINMQNELQKQREAEAEEEKRQKAASVQEKNEQLAKEITAVELECETIEQECCVLTKRNKAIMLKLRKKLIETEDLRRELIMKNVGSASTNEMQD